MARPQVQCVKSKGSKIKRRDEEKPPERAGSVRGVQPELKQSLIRSAVNSGPQLSSHLLYTSGGGQEGGASTARREGCCADVSVK